MQKSPQPIELWSIAYYVRHSVKTLGTGQHVPCTHETEYLPLLVSNPLSIPSAIVYDSKPYDLLRRASRFEKFRTGHLASFFERHLNRVCFYPKSYDLGGARP